jgi:hypothetical protein
MFRQFPETLLAFAKLLLESTSLKRVPDRSPQLHGVGLPFD